MRKHQRSMDWTQLNLKNPFRSLKDRLTLGWSDYIWVFDNDPRNRESVERITKTISRGDKVVIWPAFVEEKDINDMVQRGHNVSHVLESNTYSGLEAKVKFNIWKKV